MKTAPKIPNGHMPRLPWRLDPNERGTIIDADGVPVAWGSSTTSLKAEHTDEKGTVTREYRTTETVSACRAQMIVDAVNYVHVDMERKVA